MEELDVTIVELSRSRVASFLGFGESPEYQAWDKMLAWAGERKLYGAPGVKVYGFNNPDPSPGSPNYGYELWLTVDDDCENGQSVIFKEMPGGLYAVSQFKGIENIGRMWEQLALWRQKSRYDGGEHQWLEELLTAVNVPPSEFIFNLYLPIKSTKTEGS